MLIKIANNTTPLCFMPDGRLVCYQHGDIVLLDNCKESGRYSLMLSKKDRILGRSKLLTRFLRLGIRAAVAVDDSSVVLSLGDYLYEINLNTGVLSKGFYCGEGVRPLSFTSVSCIKGFNKGLYFGGYVHNFEKAPVHIYHRKGIDDWEVVYTFPSGSINHVHNIIPDPFRNCIWILTGDFEDSAAIWKATNDFKKIERVACGEQKWRGCVAFALPEGLLYATDAPFEKNNIYLLHNDLTVSIIAELSGSCIYGCQWKDRYVFSTVVEPDGRNETLLRLLFGWKRGGGILNNSAHILLGNLSEGFSEIFKEKKDAWPFLFQFGAFRFPAGINCTNLLLFQPIATKKNSMRLMGLKEL